jgi:hypothetical protein
MGREPFDQIAQENLVCCLTRLSEIATNGAPPATFSLLTLSGLDLRTYAQAVEEMDNFRGAAVVGSSAMECTFEMGREEHWGEWESHSLPGV